MVHFEKNLDFKIHFSCCFVFRYKKIYYFQCIFFRNSINWENQVAISNLQKENIYYIEILLLFGSLLFQCILPVFFVFFCWKNISRIILFMLENLSYFVERENFKDQLWRMQNIYKLPKGIGLKYVLNTIFAFLHHFQKTTENVVIFPIHLCISFKLKTQHENQIMFKLEYSVSFEVFFLSHSFLVVFYIVYFILFHSYTLYSWCTYIFCVFNASIIHIFFP